jgi:DNA repair protein RecO (recombination protein O)
VYYRSKGIVLKAMDYRESDKIVTIFTEKEGKISAVAKGTKKPNSSLRACVQPFVFSSLYFSQGKSMDIITQGKLLDFFGNSREDLLRTLYCIYIMELLDKSLMDKVKMPELFHIALTVLQIIDQVGYNPLLIRFFEMRLLTNLGYKPFLLECVSCGKKQKNFSCFSPAEGGVICDECKSNISGSLPISGEVLSIMKLLITADPGILNKLKVTDSAQSRLEHILESYLEYHLERKFNLKNTIRKLKRLTQLN